MKLKKEEEAKLMELMVVVEEKTKEIVEVRAEIKKIKEEIEELKSKLEESE